MGVPDHGFAGAGGIAEHGAGFSGRGQEDADITAPDTSQEFAVPGVGSLILDGGKDRASSIEDVADQGPGADLAQSGRARPPDDQPGERGEGANSEAQTFGLGLDGERQAFAERRLGRAAAEEEVAHQTAMIGVKPPTRLRLSPTTTSPTWTQQWAKKGQVRTPKTQSASSPRRQRRS